MSLLFSNGVSGKKYRCLCFSRSSAPLVRNDMNNRVKVNEKIPRTRSLVDHMSVQVRWKQHLLIKECHPDEGSNVGTYVSYIPAYRGT